MNNTVANDTIEQRKRRAARTRTIGVRVTESEYRALEGEAWKAGKTVSDWARDQIFGRSSISSGEGFQERTLTELVGIELLLINALPPLLRGERMPQERVEILWKQVQSTKGRKAQELLAKQASSEESQ